MGTKTCTKCGETKALDFFSKAKKGRFGRMSACKVCRANSLLNWQRENPEKCAVNRKRHAATQKGKGTRAKYLTEHADELNAAKRTRRAKKPSAKKLRKAQWGISPPTSKVCKGCGTEKALGQFYPNKSMFSGCENTCIACKVERAVDWKNKNPERAREHVRKCNKAHPQRARAASKKYKKVHPEKVRVTSAIWSKAHPAQNNARNSRHRAEKLKATPAWANAFFIAEAYDLAQRRTKATGITWHVDHIVPLRSKLVCGLHVENNLQLLPAAENSSKGNRHWPNMP